MTKNEMRAIAKEWLAPMDSVLADLIDKSNRMTIGAFEREVEIAIEKIAQLYSQLDQKALEDAIFEAMSEAAANAIKE